WTNASSASRKGTSPKSSRAARLRASSSNWSRSIIGSLVPASIHREDGDLVEVEAERDHHLVAAEAHQLEHELDDLARAEVRRNLFFGRLAHLCGRGEIRVGESQRGALGRRQVAVLVAVDGRKHFLVDTLLQRNCAARTHSEEAILIARVTDSYELGR